MRVIVNTAIICACCLGAASALRMFKHDVSGQTIAGDVQGTVQLPLTALQKASSVAYVTAYGADGSDDKDDTQAIQAALDSVQGGGRVWFPAGRYLVSEPIVIPGPWITLASPARGAAIIVCTQSDVAVFTAAADSGAWNVGFERIFVESVKDAGNVKAWDFTDTLSSSWLRDCGATLRGPSSYGIYVGHALSGKGPYYVTIDNFVFSGHFQEGSCGVKFARSVGQEHGSRTANVWRIEGGRIAACDIGIDLQGAGHVLHAVTFESCNTAIRLGNDDQQHSATGCHVTSCYFEGNDLCVRIGATAYSNLIAPGYASLGASGFLDDNEQLGNNTIIGPGNMDTRFWKRITVRYGSSELALEATEMR